MQVSVSKVHHEAVSALDNLPLVGEPGAFLTAGGATAEEDIGSTAGPPSSHNWLVAAPGDSLGS